MVPFEITGKLGVQRWKRVNFGLFLSKFNLKEKAIVPGDLRSVMASTNAGDFIGYSAGELLLFCVKNLP
ncbi:MAG: hypothetical protein ABR976_10955 [Terracidiphilus sp.]|jgi:hypothetical protein